jgi:predicted RNA methylase
VVARHDDPRDRRVPAVESIAIANALRTGLEVADELFDRIFPKPLRARSELHWTPVDVARVVAQLLAPARHVLDVGAGVGKACLVGALASPCEWTGIERDPELVAVGNAAAVELGIDHRARLVQGEIAMADWSRFAGFYLYNPFGADLFATDDPLRRRAAWRAEVELVERRLHAARAGTRVVTYHGFGGELAGYRKASSQMLRESELALWIRQG